MKHGEVWWIRFDPSIGGEIRGQVTSADLADVERAIKVQLGL